MHDSQVCCSLLKSLVDHEVQKSRNFFSLCHMILMEKLELFSIAIIYVSQFLIEEKKKCVDISLGLLNLLNPMKMLSFLRMV